MENLRKLAVILCLGAFCNFVDAQTDAGNLILTSNDIGTVQAFTWEIRLTGPNNDWIKHRLHGPNGIVTPVTYLWQNLAPASYEIRATVFLDDCEGGYSQTITREVLALKPEPPIPTIDGQTDGTPTVDPVNECNNDPSCTVITLF